MSVVLYVELGRFSCMMCCVVVVSVSRMRMVRGGLMVAGFVVPGCFAMVLRGVIVMLRGLLMMFGSLLRHNFLLLPFRPSYTCGREASW